MQEELGSLLHQLGTFGKCANDPKKTQPTQPNYRKASGKIAVKIFQKKTKKRLILGLN